MNVRIDLKFAFNALLLFICLAALGFSIYGSYNANKGQKITEFNQQIHNQDIKINKLSKEVKELNKLNTAYKAYNQAIYVRLNEVEESLLKVEQYAKNLEGNKATSKKDKF